MPRKTKTRECVCPDCQTVNEDGTVSHRSWDLDEWTKHQVFLTAQKRENDRQAALKSTVGFDAHAVDADAVLDFVTDNGAASQPLWTHSGERPSVRGPVESSGTVDVSDMISAFGGVALSPLSASSTFPSSSSDVVSKPNIRDLKSVPPPLSTSTPEGSSRLPFVDRRHRFSAASDQHKPLTEPLQPAYYRDEHGAQRRVREEEATLHAVQRLLSSAQRARGMVSPAAFATLDTAAGRARLLAVKEDATKIGVELASIHRPSKDINAAKVTVSTQLDLLEAELAWFANQLPLDDKPAPVEYDSSKLPHYPTQVFDLHFE